MSQHDLEETVYLTVGSFMLILYLGACVAILSY